MSLDFKQLTQAKELLGLHNRTSLAEIKRAYRPGLYAIPS